MTRKTEVAVDQQNDSSLIRSAEEERYVTPLADVVETADSFMVVLDMPGVKKEDISVTVEANGFTVKGHIDVVDRGDGTVLYNEIPGSGYHRTFNIGEGIDRNNVDAHYDLGVLTIKLFKTEDRKPKHITIK